MRTEPCLLSRTTDGCPYPGIARWFYATGWDGWLCEGHLNIWLDNADDEPDLEPIRLEWAS